jgi:hypothetical protein
MMLIVLSFLSRKPTIFAFSSPNQQKNQALNQENNPNFTAQALLEVS